ncbi:site-specific DNA-methyltransferase [Microbacterium abyssi]|uniref:site-specific DNA-methyltransferase n=1 Tax=Microbacterium abyssi TaxID=2782166 RepID=UPI0018891D2A|nr:site-specific DNA-methyltransferase [Microbacterium sp. A18JL241]
MAYIHELIKQVRATNAELGDRLAREVNQLAQRRAFGLNFERHTPEAVELPGRRPRVGDKVHILPPRGETPKGGEDQLWTVTSLSGDSDARTADLEARGTGDKMDATTVDVADLVVVAEFRDPIYPGLVSTGRIERGGGKPFHSVINAENYHALQALLYTHRGRIDAIYIDPPYNTGNDGWIYNDKYVSSDDMYRHSKWLAFMERRLLLAKELLAPTGVIIVAIGDEEHHRLRMLMDQVFSAQNFLSDVVWQGGAKSYTRYVSNGADYMLVYAKDEPALVQAEVQWREKKPGLDEALAMAAGIWAHAVESADAQRQWRAWLKSLGKGKGFDAIARYSSLDENGRPIRTDGSMVAPEPRPNRSRRPLTHPITQRPTAVPANGWRYSNDEMDRRVAAGRVYFGDDESRIPSEIYRLEEMDTRVAESVFSQDRNRASGQLAKVFGDRRFPNPKDVDVLARWLRLIAPDDAVILDFFGGSGSTAEAVMRLNNADGGTRNCILVTNNELAAKDSKRLIKEGLRPGDDGWRRSGVFEHVTRPRLSTVASGLRDDGTIYSEGLDQNVEFFTLTYEASMRVQSHREFEKISSLLWLRAGSRGRRIEELPNGWDVAETYGVIDDMDKTDAFVEAMTAASDASIAFIVTDEDRFFEAIAGALPAEVEVVRLYDSYLRNFEIDAMRGAR